MSSRITMLTAIVVSTVTSVAAAQAQDIQKPYSPEEAAYSVGYDLGAAIAEQLVADGIDADLVALVRGFEHALYAAVPEVDAERMRRILERIHAEVAGRIAAKRMETDPVFRAQAEANAKHGEDVRDRFSQRERVIVLPDGVMYEPLHIGDGPAATNADTIVLTYESRHADGTPIVREHAREIRVGSLLDGAQMLVRQMKVGDRWFILVPPERAYGLGGRDPDIGPNETILLDVELLGVSQ